MARTVILYQDDYEAILAHSRKVWNEEACGLIAGVDRADGVREIRKIYILENKDHINTHFTLDPHDQLKAVQDMRANGIKPLGNWHSHPETPSRQSEEDIRLAFDSNASYLILSLEDQEHPVIHSFHTQDGISKREDLQIVQRQADRT